MTSVVSAEPVIPYVPDTRRQEVVAGVLLAVVDDEQADRPVLEDVLQPGEVLDVDLVRVAPGVAAGADALQGVDRHQAGVGVLVQPVDELLLEALAELRGGPADLEPAAGHGAVAQGGPEARLAAPLAVLEREVQDVALLDRAAEQLAAEGDLDRDLVDEAALAELRRAGEDRRALGQQVGDDPLQGRDVELEQVGGVDRARLDLLHRPRLAGRVRRRAEALGDLRGHAVEVGAELRLGLRDLEPRGDLGAHELPQLVEPEARVVAAGHVVADGGVAAAARDPVGEREAAGDGDDARVGRVAASRGPLGERRRDPARRAGRRSRSPGPRCTRGRRSGCRARRGSRGRASGR